MISTAELANKEFTGLKLPAPYGDFLGEIPTDAAMSVWGPPGSGKSTWALYLALILAGMQGKGIYCSSEEGPGPSLQNKIKRLKAEHDNLLVDDFSGFNDLKAKLDFSDAHFVVIDSISKSHIKVADFQQFLDWCKANDVISIFILHTTKDGTYKGPTEYIHDPDIEVRVLEDGTARTDNKNRYQETPREMQIEFERGERTNPSNSTDDNIRSGIEAMKKVIQNQEDVDKAMKHPELGWISFIWGRKGNAEKNFAGGYGISKIIAKRNLEGKTRKAFEGQKGEDVALRIPIIIDKGTLSDTYEDGRKRNIEYLSYRVILRLDKDGEDQRWVLTAYRQTKRKNPDEPDELKALEQAYASEAYMDKRPQMGAGFNLSKDTKNPGIDESLLDGVPYIENPDEELRENKAVEPDEIYQMITDQVINTIEKVGHLPWQQEWDDTGLYQGRIATNFVSKNPYRGINFFLLNFEQKIVDGKLTMRLKKFENPYFLTFDQINDLDGKLKEGSRGYKVIYFTRLYKYENAEDPDNQFSFSTYDFDEMVEWLEENRGRISLFEDGFTAEQIANQSYIPILKYYNVYNGEDIEGIDFGEMPENENASLSNEQKIQVAEEIYEHYPTAPQIKNLNPKAYYTPQADFINMPKLDDFSEPQFYYTTLFHEAIHSTGHSSRLDRNMKGNKGSQDYAKEELIAEMGAVYLCAESGILFRTIDNSAKYLQTWNKRLVKKMKDDNRFFFRAASKAQAATDFILDRNDQGMPAYRKDLDVSASTKESEHDNSAESDTKDLVYLGISDRIKIDGNDHFEGMKGQFLLVSNSEMTKLFLVPMKYVSTVKKSVKNTETEELFELWHNYQADDKDFKIDWPDTREVKNVGTAGLIFYTSDKIIRPGDQKEKDNYYKHHFDKGKRPVGVMDDVLVIENINWNERGILN